MPGTPASYLNTGSSALTKLLNQPIPGVNTAGYDSLSSSYDSAEQSGLSDIASRGLTTTGAVPSMYSNLNTSFQQGAAQVNAQGASEEEQQRLQILNSLLGLGSVGLNVSKAGEGGELEDISGAGGVLEGLFGSPGAPNYVTGAPGSSGGLLSSGLYGSNPSSLLSKLLGI